MTKKTTKRTDRASAKMQRTEDLAKKLGVSASAVWTWKRNRSLPKNPNIRAAYLKALGLSESVKS